MADLFRCKEFREVDRKDMSVVDHVTAFIIFTIAAGGLRKSSTSSAIPLGWFMLFATGLTAEHTFIAAAFNFEIRFSATADSNPLFPSSTIGFIFEFFRNLHITAGMNRGIVI